MLNDNCYSSYHLRDPRMRSLAPAGRQETVLLNGEGTALPGNLKLGIFAGLSMGPFAKVSVRKTGGRR